MVYYLLGELRRPEGIAALLQQIRRIDCDFGRMNDDESHSAWMSALAHDKKLADLSAQAISAQGRAAALPAIL